jgi:hypothetical protein
MLATLRLTFETCGSTGNIIATWPLPDGDPSLKLAHVTLQTAATKEATTFFLQLRSCTPQPGRPRAEAPPTLDRRRRADRIIHSHHFVNGTIGRV